MTNREFCELVIKVNADNEELVEKANEIIASLDKRNANRKSADSKAKKETADRRNAVLAFLVANGEWCNRDTIAVGANVTPSQASSACSALIKENLVEKKSERNGKSEKIVYKAIVQADEE